MPHSTQKSDWNRACYLSILVPSCHPLVEDATRDVENFYLRNWHFGNEKARKKFIAAGFSKVSCLYFPKARDDRIRFVCSLLSILFLVDDELEYMSLKEGEAYNEQLMQLCAGNVLPDRSKPVQWIMYELWNDMRACDNASANDVLEPVCIFMKAQTSKERLAIKGLGQYLDYRQEDVGQGLLAALARFSMGLNLSQDELESVADLERNVGRHISLVNDIYSFEKERQAAEDSQEEGGRLCNAVQVFSEEVGLGTSSSKRVLWSFVRECEYIHEDLTKCQISKSCSSDLRAYVKALEFHMSGNESWSATTKRYHSLNE